jgi:predicted transcriptional regulator
VVMVNLGNRATLLLEVVKLLPGIHLRELQRRTGLGLGNTVYQLRKLESLGLVDSERNGRYRRYYPADLSLKERSSLSVLLHPNRRLIITSLLFGPPLNLPGLASKLRLGKSTAIWHLRILEAAGLVFSSVDSAGLVVWRLTDPENATRILRRHNASALDRLSESFLESWDLLSRN